MLSVHAVEIPEQVDIGAQAILSRTNLIQRDLRSLITISISSNSLLVVLWNRASITISFRDIRPKPRALTGLKCKSQNVSCFYF